MTKTTIILHSDSLGKGSDELGRAMTTSFLLKLRGSDKKPDTIIFYNSAVHLLTEKSSVLDSLTGLSKAGVDLVACQKCIGFFELEKKIVIGRIVEMAEIVSILMKSDKVITP
jgi:intracellular sulfur oxidation DsrE/DsrF family protein